jgi:hypothetical protein
MIAVIEYIATANFNDDSLKIKSTSDAIITAGVAPR